MPLIASDDFTGTNGTNLTAHTMPVGSGWTAQSGAATISSNQVTNAVGTVYTTSTIASDVRIILDVITLTAAFTGIVLRYQDSSNYIICSVDAADFSPARISIVTNISGSFALAASAPFVGLPATIIVTAIGTSITLSDGWNSCSATVSNGATAKNHGLYMTGSAGGVVDNFIATSILHVTATEVHLVDTAARTALVGTLAGVDSLLVRSRTAQCLPDALATATRTANSRPDVSATSQSTTALLVDSGKVQAASALVPIEGLASPLLSENLRPDASATPVIATMAYLEAMITVSRTDQACVEGNAMVNSLSQEYISVLATVQATGNLLLDTLIATGRTWTADIDSLLQRANTVAVSLESLATVDQPLNSAPDTTAVSSSGTILEADSVRDVSRSDQVAIEGLASPATTEALLADALRTAAAAAGIPITSMATVLTQIANCIDTLTQASAGMVTPIEWLRSLHEQEIIPVEWGRLPEPDEVWVADARGIVWVSPARNCIWTAQPRSIIWKPKG